MKGIITLYSPFCPFICEKVQEILFDANTSIHTQGNLVVFEDAISEIKNTVDGKKWLEVVELFRKSKTEGTQFAIDNSSKSQLPFDILQYIGL